MIIHGYSKMGVPTSDLPHKIVLFGGCLAIDGNTHMCLKTPHSGELVFPPILGTPKWLL